MGNCIKIERTTAPPTSYSEIPREELDALLKRVFKDADKQIADKDYFCAYAADVQRWLKADGTDGLSYKTDLRDCDDFAAILRGRFLEWISRDLQVQRGAAFGVCYGDIRTSESDPNERPHAVNFFVDGEKHEVWMIEPQTDALFQLTSNSTPWFILL